MTRERVIVMRSRERGIHSPRSFGLASLLTLFVVAAMWLPKGFSAPAPKESSSGGNDAIDRVRLENAFRLLRNEKIQQDLVLTDEFKKEVETLRQEASEKYKADRLEKLQNAVQQARQRAGAAVRAGQVILPANIAVNDLQLNLFIESEKLDEPLLKKLKPEQLRRLKQLDLQGRGPQALLDRRVIRALNLTADQEDKIDDLLPKKSFVTTGFARLTEEAAKETAEKTDEEWTKALKVLTSDQRRSWDKLIGKMMPTADLQSALSPNPLGSITIAPAALVPAPAIAPPPVAPVKN